MKSIIRMTAVYLLIFMVAFYLTWLDVAIVYIFIVGLLIAFLALILPQYRMLLWETSIPKLEKYLAAQRKKPAVFLFYAMANRQDDVVDSLVNQLLVKYKQPARQALYKAAYGAYRKNVTTVKDEIAHIRPAHFRDYYEALLHIEEGRLDLARLIADRISKPWMRSCLLSEIELRGGGRYKAVALAKQALQQCKGIQRYILYKNYELELPEAVTVID